MNFSKFYKCFCLFGFSSLLFSENQNFISSQEDASQPKMQQVNLTDKNSRLRIGGDYSYVHLALTGFPSFNGNLGGAQFSYEYRPSDAVYAVVASSWKQGQLNASNIKGSLLYFDAHEALGYTVSLYNRAINWSFFVGLGYRYFTQKFIVEAGDRLGYRFEFLYIPVGMLFEYEASDYLTLGLDFTWQPQTYPTHANPLSGVRWVLQLESFYVAVPFEFKLNKSKDFHLVISPFYERWQDVTKITTPSRKRLKGPSVTYDFAGVDVNLGYSF